MPSQCAVAIPIIFWHLRYQPKAHVDVGSTTIGIELSDLAVAAVIVAAVLAGRRLGFAPLRAATSLWVTGGLLFVWIAIGIAHPAGSSGYPWQTHAVTAAKFFEYALLAPATVLVIRRRADLLQGRLQKRLEEVLTMAEDSSRSCRLIMLICSARSLWLCCVSPRPVE